MIVRNLIVILFSGTIILASKDIEQRYSFPNSDINIQIEKSNGLKYSIYRGNKLSQTVYLDEVFSAGSLVPTGDGKITLIGRNNQTVTFELVKEVGKTTLIRISRILKSDEKTMDCVDLEIGKINWFGGPQNRKQYWPIEKATFKDYLYVSKETDNCAITERYWLNSRGVFFYIEPETPLFIDQNSPEYENKLCFSAKKILPYDKYTENFTFSYKIGVGNNAKDAHMLAIKTVLGKPTGYPDERMVRHPIWSTWAPFKAEVTDSIVREFANNITKYKFNNSQFEIDDDWEDCYGALTFRKNKFPDIKQLTADLKKQNFRVTLWIHPFINKNCTAIYKEAKSNGYLVADHKNNTDTKWWNSKKNDAAYIDFTKSEAVEWFSARLKRLQTEDGIDSFKFDAGESSWIPPDSVLNGSSELHPSSITTSYIRAVAKFGSMIEVRSGQNTQDLPIFLRMIDKDTNWSWDNGLPTLITTLLQLNMVGYPFVLPDMIGGNGYNGVKPDREIFIRWLQANVFMPSLQFSYAPWMYDQEVIDLCLKLTKLHDNITDYIMERFKLATETGEPVNPPIWWIDPEDIVATQIYDEFLLGDKILVAPVIVKGQVERDIYLPKGTWTDNNTNEVHHGPKWLRAYSAPLNVLPYFTYSKPHKTLVIN